MPLPYPVIHLYVTLTPFFGEYARTTLEFPIQRAIITWLHRRRLRLFLRRVLLGSRRTVVQFFSTMEDQLLQMLWSWPQVLIRHGPKSFPVSLITKLTMFPDSARSEKTAEEIGINQHAPIRGTNHSWHYPSLDGAPEVDRDSAKLVTSIYRGIVPAKNTLRHDFAIAGSLVCTGWHQGSKRIIFIHQFSANLGYTNEVIAHWISAYFLKDKLRIPDSVEGAIEEAERSAMWMKTRYPNMESWVNASYMGSLDFWTWVHSTSWFFGYCISLYTWYSWPQAVDDLLEDMELPVHRSGGNWLTWPFKVIEPKEISSLGDERREKRQQKSQLWVVMLWGLGV